MKKPTNKLLLALCIFIGIFIGGGIYTFIIADGFLMMTSKPEACSKCHIMTDVYDSWAKGEHSANAGCVDCHLPQGDFIAYWSKKAYHGLKHGYYFTVGGNPPNLEPTEMTHEDVNRNCATCHKDYAHNAINATTNISSEPLDCLSCHRTIGHLHN